MKHAWANIVLLAFVGAELASGFLGLISGSADLAIFILIHRVAGYGLIVAMAWKVAIIAFALRNRPRSSNTRSASIALLILLVVTLTLGFAWSTIGPYYYQPPFGLNWSGVSWHAYIGALILPLAIWHALKYTRTFPLPWTFWADRRSFLRFAALTVAGIGLWRIAESAVEAGSLTGAKRRFTGSHEISGRAPGHFPVVAWLNDAPAPVDIKTWRLHVGGSVERQYDIAFNELSPSHRVGATLDCTGGWHTTQEWLGVPLSDVLDAAGVVSSAKSVTVTSSTGYYRRFYVHEARQFLLASHVGGAELSHGHGFPLRLVAPGKRGFEWVKWVTSIEVNTTSKWLQPPLPIQ